MSVSTGMKPSAGIQTNASPLPDIIGLGGAVAGLGGGIATMIVSTLISLSVDGDIWLQSKQVAAIVMGSAVATEPGFIAGPVIVGTFIHLLMSVVLGALFGIITRRIFRLPSDYGTPVLAGLIYGLAIWMAAYFIVLPISNPALLETYAPSFIIQHIIFGITTGLLYTWLRPEPCQERVRYALRRQAHVQSMNGNGREQA